MTMAQRIEISKRLVLINTVSAILAKTINVSVVLWLLQYLLRRISPDEYALLPLLMSIVFLLPLFTSFLTAGLGRFMLEAYARGDDRAVTQIVSTMLPLLLAAGGLILAGGGALVWQIHKVLVIAPGQLWDARLMMSLLILAAALKPPCTAFCVGFYIQQKFVLYNLISVCSELLRVGLLCLLILGISTRVLWVVVANVTAELSTMTAMVVLSRRMIPALRFRLPEIQWGRARQLLSFGGWSFLGYMAFRMRETVILLILNRFGTALDVTVFNVGYLGRRQIDAWTDVLAGPLYPVVTGMHALGARDRVRNIYFRGGRFALWIMLLVGLPAALYASPIIRLYVGETYLEAALVMALMLASLVLIGGNWMVWQVSNATARVRAISVTILGTQIATMALAACSVYLLGWGAFGVALAAFCVGVFLETPIVWSLGLRIADVTFAAWTRETLIPGLTPGCVAAVAWTALNLLVRPNTWTALGLCIAAGTACYLGVLLALCLEPQDREDLAELLVRVRRTLGRHGCRGGRLAESRLPGFGADFGALAGGSGNPETSSPAGPEGPASRLPVTVER